MAAQTGLSLTWVKTPKTGFLVTRHRYCRRHIKCRNFSILKLIRLCTHKWTCPFFFWFGFYRPSRSFHSLWAESIKRLVKMGDPREKPPDHPQAELDLSHMWPELGSNPQRWDDKWFRMLKISVFNHKAKAATSTHPFPRTEDWRVHRA